MLIMTWQEKKEAEKLNDCSQHPGYLPKGTTGQRAWIEPSLNTIKTCMIALKKKKKKNQLRENFGTTTPVNFLISIEQFLLLNAKYGNTKSSMYIFQILLQWKKRYKGKIPSSKTGKESRSSVPDRIALAVLPHRKRRSKGVGSVLEDCFWVLLWYL